MRVVYFDIARAVAIILIVFTHAWGQLTLNPDFIAADSEWITSDAGWIIWQAVHLLTRDGVPLFAMLTGALMLGRKYPDIPGFLQKKLPKFIMATIIAAILYGALVHYLFGTSLKGDIGYILMGGKPTIDGGGPIGAYHLWYMYMLIGLYISIPFLSRMLAAMDQSELVFLILMSFLLVTIPTTLSEDSSDFSYFSAYSFIIQTYALYALLGYWLHKYNGLHNIPLNIRGLLFLALMALTIYVKYRLLYPAAPLAQMDTISTYDSLYVYAGSILLFSMIRDYFANTQKMNRFVALLAVSSWSIYLWHLIAIHLMNYFYHGSHFNPFIAIGLGFIAALALGVILYYALCRTRLAWLVQ